jgi:mono/diheme cytochrome c family protein
VWPGTRGGAGAAPPLTAEEQKRFDAGREVYRTLCTACHQQDGRGLEKIAPTLIGSPLALSGPSITARILLNGKEGPVGLMPPLGAVLNDDQMAAVLTYIRREWGHTGAAVTAAEVSDVRKATAGRTRPWTNDELTKLMGGG